MAATTTSTTQLPMTYGENGHIELAWSTQMHEKIVQFQFQLTRMDETRLKKMEHLLKDMLSDIQHILRDSLKTFEEKRVAKEYLCILYKMIGYTRDIVNGKGEYELSYMMIYSWFHYFPELACFALKCLVTLDDEHPYGSWKDIKLLCSYCMKRENHTNSPLITYAIKLFNQTLATDYANSISNCDTISLAAKWVPREKSKYGWLFEMLAKDYFRYILDTANTEESYKRAVLKCKTDYRKLISGLNKKIDTLQIKQCNGEWSAIDFDKVTSISMLKQRKAFLNVKKNGQSRYSDNEDRIECANKFSHYIDTTESVKGKRVSMGDFTKQAIDILNRRKEPNTKLDCEYKMLNMQWTDNAGKTTKLGKMIAMVDVSSSMSGDPMNAAIALGIRIAEKSMMGNRVMTFSMKPSWIQLGEESDFISKVEAVMKNSQQGLNTNLYAALDLVLNAIIESNMDAVDVEDMVLVILSDMQIDQCDNCDKMTLYDTMRAKYADAGMQLHGKPFKPPHILFWNLRNTNGFPCSSTQPNVTMMAGFSPMVLDLFFEGGVTSLQSCTPWTTLQKSLENKRYERLGLMLNDTITF
jgi:Mg-chelatase subunit ChlD